MPCRLTVNAREFTLADDHATSVSEKILDAARDGGAYVRISPISGPEADVLVTPATTILFQRLIVAQPEAAGDADLWPGTEVWPDDYI